MKIEGYEGFFLGMIEGYIFYDFTNYLMNGNYKEMLFSMIFCIVGAILIALRFQRIKEGRAK